MKDKLLLAIARQFIKRGHLKILIVDDKNDFFNETILSVSRAIGYNIERCYYIDEPRLEQIIKSPPDLIILDIKDICDPKVAKDGFQIASLLTGNTNSYVALTSSHMFHLESIHKAYDYIIGQRLLTALDFNSELEIMIDEYLSTKVRFYNKVLLRVGLKIMKMADLMVGLH